LLNLNANVMRVVEQLEILVVSQIQARNGVEAAVLLQNVIRMKESPTVGL
jgi:hypothetical protein